MEDLSNLHYIKEKELPAINHIFYDNSDGYRIKKRKELYNPYDKSVYDIYSKCTLTNYDVADPEKNINSTFRRDYTRKKNQRDVKENRDLSKEVKNFFESSHIDLLQDYKKDKAIDFNNENNSRIEREKDDGLSRCYDPAHLDNDTDEVYKKHFMSTMVKDYTRKPLSKRDPILNNNLNKFGTIYRDNNELKEKKLSTYEHDYYAKELNIKPKEHTVPAKALTHFKLEDYNCELTNPFVSEMKDNYKPFQVDHVIAAPDTSKYHFITNPDYKENPFESSMKNDYKQYEADKYHKADPCEKQDKAQFELGHDTNDNHTLYQDTYIMSNEKIKNAYEDSNNLPKLGNRDHIQFGTDPDDLITTHRHDYRVNKAAKAKAFNDSRNVFDGIKEIITGIPLNLTWNDDRVKQSIMHSDYTAPNVDDKDKTKRVNPGIYDTNQYLRTNNKLGEKDTDPKLSTHQSDYVNYPNQYKYNPRRQKSDYQTLYGLFKNDVYNDETLPRNYRTCYKTDYQDFDSPVRRDPIFMKTDFDTTLNEIFPKEVRTHSIKKQSVTHKNFNEKPIPPIERANKQAIENNAIDFLEHTNFETDADNKKISIAHSSYIAPEITIDRNKMSIPLRNVI